MALLGLFWCWDLEVIIPIPYGLLKLLLSLAHREEEAEALLLKVPYALLGASL